MLLVVYVGALGGIVVRAGRFFYDFHVKTYRESLRGKALGVVAGLVAEDAMHDVLARLHGVQRMHRDRDGEISAVYVQLFIGRKGEA